MNMAFHNDAILFYVNVNLIVRGIKTCYMMIQELG